MQMSGMIGLLVAIIVSRFVAERGYATLSPDEKLRLMDGFAKSRKYSLIPLVVLAGAFFLLMKQTEINPAILMPFFFALMIVYIVVNTVLNQRKLRSLDMPPTYRRYFTLAQAISVAGLAWLFFTVLWERGSR